MIRLTQRLQVIADRIAGCKTMADIGTDHGFLPCSLVEHGVCQKAIASDISEASLGKAEALKKETGLDSVELRTGDGLKVLAPGEVEGIVIAGMGGNLIMEILGEDLAHTASFGRFVLQPRSAAGELRKWLKETGFAITGEDIVREGKFLPEIITACPPGNDRQGFDNLASASVPEGDILYYEVPPWILHASGPLEEYLARRIRRQERVLAGLQCAHHPDGKRIQSKQEGLRYLQELIKRVQSEGETI